MLRFIGSVEGPLNNDAIGCIKSESVFGLRIMTTVAIDKVNDSSRLNVVPDKPSLLDVDSRANLYSH